VHVDELLSALWQTGYLSFLLPSTTRSPDLLLCIVERWRQEETTVHLFTTRAPTVASGLIACALIAGTLTGCSSGQQSQTAVQEPAVNGAAGGVGDMTLRDVRIDVPDGVKDTLPAGKPVDLVFVATNQSPIDKYKLMEIRTDVGATIKVTPERPEIRPLRALSVSSSSESATKEFTDSTTGPVRASAKFTPNPGTQIRSGLTYKLGFVFERTDLKDPEHPQVSTVLAEISVPTAAGPEAKREEAGGAEGH
jgi:hypothetical protein